MLERLERNQDRYRDLFNLATLLCKEGSISHKSYEFVFFFGRVFNSLLGGGYATG